MMLVVASSIRELEGIGNGEGRVIGVGKANAALYTASAIGELHPDLVVLVGTARALDSALRIGDVVSARSVWQHDVDLRSFGFARGEIPGPGGEAVGELDCLPVEGTHIGRCASGDVFVTRSYQDSHPELASSLFCDMESYAVALSCRFHGIPCMVLRVISDDWYGHRPRHWGSFLEEANKQIGQILLHLPQGEVADDLHHVPVMDDLKLPVGKIEGKR